MRKFNTSGFTLIELIIVFSVLSILSVIGVASFVSFSRTQAVDNEVNQFITTLNLAKAKAQSQVKPTVCTINQPLSAYLVSINTNNSTYTFLARCTGRSDVTVTSRKLASPVVISSANPTDYVFDILTGSFVPGQIVIKGNWTPAITRTITINSDGSTSVQ